MNDTKTRKKKLQKKNNEIRFKWLKITISPLLFLYVYVVQTKKIKIKKEEEEEEDNDAKSIFFFKKTQPSKPKVSRIKIYL